MRQVVAVSRDDRDDTEEDLQVFLIFDDEIAEPVVGKNKGLAPENG